MNADTPEDEEGLEGHYVICGNCEAEYTVILEEDYLDTDVDYCSFCGERLEKIWSADDTEE